MTEVQDLFLSPAELAGYTDRQHADAQIAFLEAKGIPFEVSAKGRPKVLRSVVFARCGGSIPKAEPKLHL